MRAFVRRVGALLKWGLSLILRRFSVLAFLRLFLQEQPGRWKVFDEFPSLLLFALCSLVFAKIPQSSLGKVLRATYRGRCSFPSSVWQRKILWVVRDASLNWQLMFYAFQVLDRSSSWLLLSLPAYSHEMPSSNMLAVDKLIANLRVKIHRLRR